MVPHVNILSLRLFRGDFRKNAPSNFRGAPAVAYEKIDHYERALRKEIIVIILCIVHGWTVIFSFL